MKKTSQKTIHQITFMPRVFPVNCYFVEEEEGLTLIDTALSFSVKGILACAEALGKPITRIILTHAHDDHVGGLDGLKASLPDVPVYISKRDARIMVGDLTLDPEEPQTAIKGGVSSKLRTRADVLLEEGDRVGSLLAIHTPGHTPGSMSFLDARNQHMIVGDAFQTRGGLAVSGKLQPLFPFPAFGTWDKILALESAKKILKVEPSLLAVGHGKMIDNPNKELKTAIKKAEQVFSK